jgi:undecaprenyl-diphosphatase
MNLLWVAAVLGVVEGLTEFLPVSSTGHLILAGRLLGWTGAGAATFEIFIQLGAILAVVVIERRRFLGLLTGLFDKSSGGFSGARGLLLLGTTTAPVLVAGYLFHDTIKTRLFGPGPVVAALLAGGVAMLLVERFLKAPRIAEVDGLTWGPALAIGVCQCLALWPGVSRSAATILGGMLCGLSRRAAATYSFLAAVPALSAAVLYDLHKSWGLLQPSDAAPFAVGFVVSFLAAWAAVRTFVALLSRFTLRPFAWYRIAVAPLAWWIVR